MPDPVRLDDIQAHILTPFRPHTAAYLFLAIDDPQAFVADLGASVIGRLTSEAQVRAGRDGGSPLTQARILGLTEHGLARLALRPDLRARLPEAFVEGMARRAGVLGDGGASDPLHWERGFGTGEIDLVLCVLDRDGAQDAAALAAAEPLPAGTSLVTTSIGRALVMRDGGRAEPFGFRDGISQPEVDLAPQPGRRSGPIALGEFVLGHPDESDLERNSEVPAGDLLDGLLHNGSYMVFRKIEQHPDRLDAFVAGLPAGERERVGAELVGRWKSGAVLDAAPPPANPTRDEIGRDFTFAGNAGHPLGSHIRRANPRDDQPARRVRHHRLLRRGLPYQEGASKGVLFVCFNARLDDQFELVQSQWLNNGNFKDLPSEQIDPIAGTRAGRPARGSGGLVHTFTRADGTQVEVPVLTSVRGGEYFLVPGIDALRSLAGGAFASPSPAPPAAPPASHDLFVPAPADLPAIAGGDAFARPLPGSAEKLYFVGRPDRVVEVLANDRDFEVSTYDERIRRLTGGGRLMVGMSSVHDAALRDERRRLLHHAFGTHQAPSQAADVQRVVAIVNGVLAPLVGRSGPLDFVEAVVRPVPLAVLVAHLGIRPPVLAEPSPAALAFYFGQPRVQEIPRPWIEGLKRGLGGPEGFGRFSLALWIRALFIETFGNWYEIPEVRLLARMAIDELRAHLEEVARAPLPDSVFDRALKAAAAPEDAHLLLLELTVGGTETTGRALANVVDVLLGDAAAMKAARAAAASADGAGLDAVIHECLRFQPVAGMLVRRTPAGGCPLGSVNLDPRSLVCDLTAVASRHPAAFPQPDAFRTDRTPASYLTFGAGPHACAGAWLALLQVREVLRFFLGNDGNGQQRFPHFRRAAGVRGEKKEEAFLPVSLYVRLDP